MCNFKFTLEPVGLDRGDDKRPHGLAIFPWRFGKALVWDVTVVDTLAQSYVAATSQLAGSAADAAEARKQRKYAALEQQFIVQPIGFEIMGSWSQSVPKRRRQPSEAGHREPKSLGIFATAGKYRDPARRRGFSYGDSRQHQGLKQFVLIILVTLFSLI